TNSHIKVGVYDSRSIAIAYTGSKFHNDWIQSLKQRRDEAVSKKDNQRVKAIEQEASDRQTLLHKQGFGTFPVDDILTVVSNQVSKIQADAHVSDLISKWDSAQLAKIPE